MLVVDDHSPDGTGALADTLAAANPRVEVLHRSRKEGLGMAYRDGFRRVLDRPGTMAVVQMDADLSHDPADLPRLVAPLMRDADLVLGTRWMPGGGTRRLAAPSPHREPRRHDLCPHRAAAAVPGPDRRLQGLATRAARGHPPARGRCARGTASRSRRTWWAHRRGATIREIPIIFREREAGHSKMSGGIVFEAIGLVLRLRWHDHRPCHRGVAWRPLRASGTMRARPALLALFMAPAPR